MRLAPVLLLGALLAGCADDGDPVVEPTVAPSSVAVSPSTPGVIAPWLE